QHARQRRRHRGRAAGDLAGVGAAEPGAARGADRPPPRLPGADRGAPGPRPPGRHPPPPRDLRRAVAAGAAGHSARRRPRPRRRLAPEVTLWADGGGKAPAAGRRPIHGRDRVARLLTLGVTRSPVGLQGLGVRYRQVNGDPAALLFAGDAPFAVIVLDLTPDG